jgi:hypothetical protein
MQRITIPAVGGDMRCVALQHDVIILMNTAMMMLVVVPQQALDEH